MSENTNQAFCSSCGKENLGDASFCSKCGKALDPEKMIAASMHCVKCGTNLSDNDQYCQNCGQARSKSYGTEKIERVSILPQEIREKLSRYKQFHQNATCEECGYVGKMGVVKTHVPWYVTWWVIIPLCFTGIGIIGGVILGFLRGLKTVYEADCPNCDKRIFLVTRSFKI
jgi:hypothetical protein